MNWLDDYIKKNETGYLLSEHGGLFVSIDKERVRHAKGYQKPVNLKEISKDLFLELLIK